ncbi:MAG: hypothetical protein EOP83_02445 [Verrucomicrobiaceae bacterium]|nr:MAG: hypothetical protein EOP83_02445 [Verrucomicrobiaceae bacterium]
MKALTDDYERTVTTYVRNDTEILTLNDVMDITIILANNRGSSYNGFVPDYPFIYPAQYAKLPERLKNFFEAREFTYTALKPSGLMG